MNRLEALYNVTKQLNKVLQLPVDSTNREEIIKKVNELINQRGTYLKDVTPPYTEEEKQLGSEIVTLNNQIEKQMKLIFNSLKQEMKQTKKQKSTNESYVNPYGDMNTADGMFLDNKL